MSWACVLFFLCLGFLCWALPRITTEQCFSFLLILDGASGCFGDRTGTWDGWGEQHIEGVYVVFTLVGHHVSFAEELGQQPVYV